MLYLKRFSLWSRLAPALAVAALGAGTAWAQGTVGIFTGGDPGEGLDLQGNFTYAVNMGTAGAAGKAGDANFTADTVVGLTYSAANNVNPWLAATLGDTENDNVIENVLRSIRWAAAPDEVRVQLRVESGIEYKLQLLLGEDCCPGRGFNVIVNGETLAFDLMPGVLQSPNFDFANEKFLSGVVLTHQFTSPTNILDIVLSGPQAQSFDITDRNAIINGLTLERISPVVDTDNDGLRDDWENSFFANLDQTGSGDFDSDGLTNLEELTLALDPTKADTDGDGLTDGDEVDTYKTDPTKVDSDGDGLRDGVEVTVHSSDPAKRDTDADTFSDYDEVRMFSNPASAQSVPRRLQVGLFTGGAPGEGLDLQGNFVYALDHAVPEGVIGGQVGDAFFTPETADGATVTTGNKTGLWNGGINYGDTPEDFVLADVMGSISWSAAGAAIPDVTVEMGNLQVGSQYKLQLLFAEQAWPRGFDVYIDDMFVMDDFAPVFYQGGGFPLSYPDDRGVVLTHTFVARASTIRIILDGNTTTTPEFTDHNAIINASTLELIGPAPDTDGDSLPDPWENDWFGNLTATGSQDGDGDGLTNAQEFTNGTDPTKADTDGDGLNDAAEVAAGTKPGLRDTDRDGLSDSEEVNTYATDPLNPDTDGDLFTDGVEVSIGFDPKNAVIEFVTTGVTLGGFTGGDAGEGLDLDGYFPYAFSILPNTAATGTVRDAVFTSENVSGVTVSSATSVAANWYRPTFGDTPNDDVLERVVSNIRHGGNGVTIRLENLVVGRQYKLQLMFGEACCFRGMDIFVDGKQIADDFAPYEYQGGEINNPLMAAVVTYQFTATKNQTIIRTDGRTVTNESYVDRNPIINALTLEDLSGAPVLPPAPTIRATSRQAGSFAVTVETVNGRSYTLQYKAKITDANWTNVSTVNSTGTSTTLTDNDATRLSGPTGFWRVSAQ